MAKKKQFKMPPPFRGKGKAILNNIQTPILLFYPPYNVLSLEAKFLYGLLLHRMNLSYENPERWEDGDGAFVYFQRQEVMQWLNITEKPATRLFEELEDIGLIRRKRQGFGKPAKIYINEYWTDVDTTNPVNKTAPEEPPEEAASNAREEKGQNSPYAENEGEKRPLMKGRNAPSMKGRNASSTEYKYMNRYTSVNQAGDATATNHTETANKVDRLTFEEVEKQVARQIDWDALTDECTDTAQLRTIAAIMKDAISSDAPREKIGGATRTRAEIRARLADVTTSDVAKIMDKLGKMPYNGVTNLHGYILTCLYNEPISRDPKRRDQTDEYQEEIRKYAQALKRKREKKAAKTAE